MFIHLIEGSRKYDVGIVQDGVQELQDEVVIFNDNTFTTVADVLEKVGHRFINSTVHLYNEHGKQLQSNIKVENARVYTIRRKPKYYNYMKTQASRLKEVVI